MKNLIQWLLMRKMKNAAGELEAKGYSVTKICAVVIGAMQAVEFISPYFGSPVKFDQNIYLGIASIGGIALREGIDKSAPPKP